MLPNLVAAVGCWPANQNKHGMSNMALWPATATATAATPTIVVLPDICGCVQEGFCQKLYSLRSGLADVVSAKPLLNE